MGKTLRGLVLPTALAATWWAVSHGRLVAPALLPTPERVASAFAQLVNDGTLAVNLKASFRSLLAGVLIGTSAGSLLGILIGVSRSAERLIGPLFHGIRQIPLMGWVPLLVLLCGVGEGSRVAFIALGASYPIVLSTVEGIRSVKKEYVEVGHVLEYRGLPLLMHFILPSTLPPFITGIRLSLSKAWGLLVAAELFFASRGGLGSMMAEGRAQWRMDVVLVGVAVIGAIGLLLDHVARLCQARLLQWRNTFS